MSTAAHYSPNQFVLDDRSAREFIATSKKHFSLARFWPATLPLSRLCSQAITKARLQEAVLAFCMLIVAVVAADDVYWSFKTQDVLAETEENPVGRWLIQMDGGDIALFMTCKMFGVLLVLLALPAIFWFRRSWGLICSISLAVFQIALFMYLNFAGTAWTLPWC